MRLLTEYHRLRLQQMLPEDSRKALSARCKLLNSEDWQLCQPERLLQAALRGESFENLRFSADLFLNNFQDILAEMPSFVCDYENRLKLCSDGNDTVRTLQDELGSEWTLSEAKTQSNRWKSALNARVNEPLIVFRAQHKTTASYLDFYFTDAKVLHGLIFKVGAIAESRFWTARKDFSALAEACFAAGVSRITGTLLTTAGQFPLQRAPEWRFEKTTGEESRLLLFWKRLGAVTFPAQPDSFTFYPPADTAEVKATFEAQGWENPFALLNRSIYGKELEKSLRRAVSENN